jgi:hypothetical protein
MRREWKKMLVRLGRVWWWIRMRGEHYGGEYRGHREKRLMEHFAYEAF